MCGIAGVWGSEHDSVGTVTALLRAMAHRGHVEREVCSFPSGAIGATRLPFVDLDRRSNQPISSADEELTIVMNGEIYNAPQLRYTLARHGAEFSTGSDTEVVLMLYAALGDAAFGLLRGMFAVAIIDRRLAGGGKPRLVLARDGFGIKPLYVTARAGSVVFASEVRALYRAKMISGDPNRQGVSDFLAFGFVTGPHTFFREAEVMTPGCCRAFEPDGTVTEDRFYRPPARSHRYRSLDEAAHGFREVLDESVRLHSVADVPLGVLLSGGVDSSAVVALMRPHISVLKTFSLRPVDHPDLDESSKAEAFATKFDCTHFTVEVRDAEIGELVPTAIGSLDQPSMDGVNTWLLLQTARLHGQGFLSGLGADEMCAGYDVVGRMLDRVALSRATSADPGAEDVRASCLAVWHQKHGVFEAEDASWISGGSPPTALADLASLFGHHLDTQNVLSVARTLDLSVRLGNQLLRDSDAIAMSHTTEIRLPFVDREVAAFTAECSDQVLRGTTTVTNGSYGETGAKLLLRKACSDVLPGDVDTHCKRGFWLPHRRWLDGPLASVLADVLARSVAVDRGIVDERAFAIARSRRWTTGNPFPHMWSLLVLELWCRANYA